MSNKSNQLGTPTSATNEALGKSIEITEDYLTVELRDGRIIRTPLIWYPRLQNATQDDRSIWQWIGGGIGINWPLLDEDLSIKGMLDGVPSIDYRRAVRG